MIVIGLPHLEPGGQSGEDLAPGGSHARTVPGRFLADPSLNTP